MAQTPNPVSRVKISLAVGAKAGVCVGLIWGLAQYAIGLFSYPTMHHMVSVSIDPIIFSIAGGLILCILGVFFARVQEYFPYRSMKVKGMIFMIIAWGVAHFFVLSVGSLILSASILGLISYTLAGAGLGYLTSKFSKS